MFNRLCKYCYNSVLLSNARQSLRPGVQSASAYSFAMSVHQYQDTKKENRPIVEKVQCRESSVSEKFSCRESTKLLLVVPELEVEEPLYSSAPCRIDRFGMIIENVQVFGRCAESRGRKAD